MVFFKEMHFKWFTTRTPGFVIFPPEVNRICLWGISHYVHFPHAWLNMMYLHSCVHLSPWNQWTIQKYDIPHKSHASYMSTTGSL